MRLPTRSFGPLMGSAVRTAMPELSGGVGRMRVLLMRYMTSRPLPRAISGSMTELPASSALPPNTASTPSAPWETKFQVTLEVLFLENALLARNQQHCEIGDALGEGADLCGFAPR